jgi:tetratricopeptide (TPR) repeat protein
MRGRKATETFASPITDRASRLWLILLLLCACSVARAEDLSTAFDQANKLYEEGKFTESAAAYEKILRQGMASPALYFNLGNASFKSGQVGRAVLNYRLAERLAPRDPDIRANLKFARNSVGAGASPTPGWWGRWTSRLSLDEWALLTSGAGWLWLVLLALRRWRPGLKHSLSGYIATAGVASALLAGCLALESYNRFAVKSVIVAVGEAAVRYGPWNESQNNFTARDGAELTLLDSKEEWLQVSDRANRIGWLRREQVLVFPSSTPASSS